VATKAQGEFLGHPKGLYVLFFTEMWERFSYYGMRALLVLYMVNYFKWTQEDASTVYKWYTALVYLTPLIGGYLADRYLGNKNSIIIGAVLMSIGHFCMAFEQIPIFAAALVLLIIGNGFFKPNMSTQVGRLYPANDPRRDSAYTIFYMGINLGAFISPLVCGGLRTSLESGYHAGFTAAGIGMVIGLIGYLLGLRWVQEVPDDSGEVAERPDEEPEDHYMTESEAAVTPSVMPAISRAAPGLFFAMGLLSPVVGAALTLIGVIDVDDAVAFGMGGLISCMLGWWVMRQVSDALRDRVLVIFVIGLFVVFFWAAFEQAGNAMNVHADKTTNRYLNEDAPTPSLYPEVVIEDADDAADGADIGFFEAVIEWFRFLCSLI